MKKYSAFYIPYFIFVLTLVLLIFFNSKADLHLWMISCNTPLLDTFFHYYTFVGDWIPYAVIGLLLFYKYRISIFILLSQLISAIFSVSIKHLWNEPRPVKYFHDFFPSIQLHQVEGVRLYTTQSFPSGHTITAFAFFLALSFYTKNKGLHFLYFALAVLVGFSRIYLSQHFAIDVLAGSLIGVLVTAISKYYFDKFPLKWANGSLLDFFKK